MKNWISHEKCCNEEITEQLNLSVVYCTGMCFSFASYSDGYQPY